MASQTKEESHTFEVWPENHLAITVFLRLQTQWNRNPMDNSLQSLNWISVEMAIKRLPQTKNLTPSEQDSLFWDISTMERHAISEVAAVRAEQEE